MFRRVEDVKTIWAQEAEKTLAVFDAIPDAAAHQAVDAHHRDLRRLAWHLVETVLGPDGLYVLDASEHGCLLRMRPG